MNPETGKTCYFVDKCLPFGSSTSCAHFQRFSNALAHIWKFLVQLNSPTKYSPSVTNYLDDFLFVERSEAICNRLVEGFLDMCEKLSVPVAFNKTEWASTRIFFLGILLDGNNHLLAVPVEKREKALRLLNNFIDKHKATVKQIQSLAGLLNFLGKAIVPGRAFTRRMYVQFQGFLVSKADESRNGFEKRLKPHHHISLDAEFRTDCKVWMEFLSSEDHTICRPFTDLAQVRQATVLNFYSDAAKSENLGFGCIFNEQWAFGRWGDFISKCDPSIEYLELFGLVIAVFIWSEQLANNRSVVFCDNQAVVTMVNDTTSSCKNCMVLIRLLTLRCLKFNMRIFARWVKGSENQFSDALSRLQFKRFWHLVEKSGRTVNRKPNPLPDMLWPPAKLWIAQQPRSLHCDVYLSFREGEQSRYIKRIQFEVITDFNLHLNSRNRIYH